MKLLNWRMAAAVAVDTLGPSDSSSVEGVRRSRRRSSATGCSSGSSAPSATCEGSPGRGAARRGRARRPRRPDQHVRGRRRRGAAGDRRHRRPRHGPPTPMTSGGAVTTETDEFLAELRGLRGPVEPGHRGRCPTPVNQPMIRHWVEAMGDENPVYIDAGRRGAVGARRDHRPAGDAPGVGDARPAGPPANGRRSARQDRLLRLLDGAGSRRSWPPNCEQEYDRELHRAHVVTVESVIDSVSEEKRPRSASAISSPHA